MNDRLLDRHHDRREIKRINHDRELEAKNAKSYAAGKQDAYREMGELIEQVYNDPDHTHNAYWRGALLMLKGKIKSLAGKSPQEKK